MSERLIELIDIDTGTVTLSDGSTISVTDAFDEGGGSLDLEDLDYAVTAVAGPDVDGLWYSIALENYEPVTIH